MPEKAVQEMCGELRKRGVTRDNNAVHYGNQMLVLPKARRLANADSIAVKEAAAAIATKRGFHLIVRDDLPTGGLHVSFWKKAPRFTRGK